MAESSREDESGLTTPLEEQHSQHREDHDAPEEDDAIRSSSPPLLQQQQEPTSLSLPLCILFAFNGISLGLPMVALLYVVNTRVAVPLSLLPTYGALSFLPWSLKPAYAALTSQIQRNHAIAVLLVMSGLSIGATAWIPAGGIVLCFVLGMLRGLFSAWPEFLLGLTLVDQARSNNTVGGDYYEETCARFQAQAATARNSGELVSHLVASGILLTLGRGEAVNHQISTLLLLLTAILNVVGAGVAFWTKVGVETLSLNERQGGYVVVENTDPVLDSNSSPTHALNRSSDSSTSLSSSDSQNRSYHSCESATTADHQPLELDVELASLDRGETLTENDDDDQLPISELPPWFQSKVSLVVLLQVSVLLFAVKDLIIQASSTTFWALLAGGTAATLVLVACSLSSAAAPLEKSFRVGLYLILRYAVPSAGYLISSYIYQLFESRASIVQFMSIFNMGVITLASWSYGRLFSQFSKGTALHWVIAGTTTLRALVGLSEIVFFTVVPNCSSVVAQVGLIVLIKSIGSIVGEWKFLPDVVLATISAGIDSTTNPATDPQATAFVNRDDDSSSGRQQQQRRQRQRRDNDDNANSIGVRYGSLISCIDFGGQIGALLAAPLVKYLGISREDNWAHMDRLIEICALFMFLSTGFLVLLRR